MTALQVIPFMRLAVFACRIRSQSGEEFAAASIEQKIDYKVNDDDASGGSMTLLRVSG